MFKRLIAIILTASFIALSFISADDATAAIEVQGVSDADYEFSELIDLINKERLRLGLNELVYDASLLPYAQIRATECSYYWSHTRPDGRPWNTVDENNSLHIYRGENLARGDVDGSDSEIYDCWLTSPVHYNTMTKPVFTKIAIAHYYNPDNKKYTWVAAFGID